MIRRALFLFAPLLLWASTAQAANVKDIAEIVGVRENQLMGVGLVVGLNGSGDSAPFLAQALSNALKRLGMNIGADQARAKNAALVYLTATLPPFARPGSKIDITVSSVGDAKSLTGGTLLRTPLTGADGKVYAVAQGALAVGGFSVGGEGAGAQRNHPTVGRIPGGAIVERMVHMAMLGERDDLTIHLRQRSFLTAERLALKISEALPLSARAIDGATVRVLVPQDIVKSGKLVGLIAKIGELEIEPDVVARVVINERTGTIVAGERVRIARVAISHGNLTVTVAESPEVSQPEPFSQGQTAEVPRTDVEVGEEKSKMHVIEPTVTVSDLARALNALGVSPRDLITIFQSLKAAGALQAELVIL